jgi:hypothetical protein
VDAGPAADDPPVVGDAFAPIDLRPAPVAGGPPPAGVGAPGAALAFWLPAPVAPAAPPPGGTNSPDGGAAGGPVADARPVACDGDPAPAGGDRADAGRRCGWLGLSWKGLSGGLALIFAERALAARCAERDTIKLRAESPSPSSPGSIGPDQGDGRRIRRRTP